MQQNEVKEQKNYKDTVFRLLFSNRTRALSLYNGINGTDYHDESVLEFNTLENAIYMNLYNDISFVIVNQLHLYEHQSTLPVNLPERMELKLSDSFLIPTDNPKLELKVTVLNINEGMNEFLKEKCPDLKGYMQYVDKVRKYNEELPLKDAVLRAVDECIRENILRDFLIRQKAEVIKMSIYEFDEEREMRLIREDEREIGKEIGKEIGREEGMTIRLRKSMALNKMLLADNRIEDLKRAVDDEEYLEELCREHSV